MERIKTRMEKVIIKKKITRDVKVSGFLFIFVKHYDTIILCIWNVDWNGNHLF